MTVNKITLSKGNKKLGRIINFSIPPLTTCNKKTKLCTKFCYALKSYKQYPNVRTAWDGNYEASLQDDFVTLFNKELVRWTKKGFLTIRFHVSGDVYSLEYLDKLTSLVISNPNVTFYMYTKQWRDPDYLEGLEFMHALPNATVFASTDKETRDSREVPPSYLREAYVQPKDEKRSTSLIQCPQQTDRVESCEKCGLCFKPFHKKHGRGVNFIEH